MQVINADMSVDVCVCVSVYAVSLPDTDSHEMSRVYCYVVCVDHNNVGVLFYPIH